MEKRNPNFQKLTPISDADLIAYEEAIDFVFDNSDVRNVALSGAYSAGKSSILESYKKKHENYRFVHISLTHFQSPDQDDEQPDEPVKESVLEGKILNQLIHQIPASRIPQTNFRVKKDVNEKDVWHLTIFSILSIASLFYLLSSSGIVSFLLRMTDNQIKQILSKFIFPITTALAYFIIASFIVMIVFSIIKAQKNRNIFRKISLQGTEIEIFEEQDDSYFDKYLNEVLYLFENVDADAVVFEDMDRFNSSRIFERLREVNALVNLPHQRGSGKRLMPLRFFYLLRDDIFISKERTKFFDFIIPIVPVVDSSNSYEQFLKHLKAGNLIDKFDQSFIQSLSLYVDDMRILKNIYNEFLIYIQRLNTTDLDWNKMLAMITYKNLFPRDFNNLQLDKGYVYSLFSKKQKLIEEVSESEIEKRQRLLERIKLAKNETLVSLQELDIVYDNKQQSIRGPYGYNLDQNKKTELENEKDKRKQAIQDNSNGNLPRLESELSDLEYELTKIQTRYLKDLLSRENTDSYFSSNHKNEVGVTEEFITVKKNDYFPLLKFLIRSGYMDETYKDYMSYFYDDSISSNDKVFLRRITDKRGADYTFAIKEPLKVLSSPILRNVDFEQEETLNFDLLESLLTIKDTEEYAIYLRTLINQLKETKNFDFISKFLNTGKGYTDFVISINDQWADFLCAALHEKVLSTSQIKQYTLETLYSSNEDVLNVVNQNVCLTNYISQSPDYLVINQPDIEKLIIGFVALEVAFVEINYDASNKELFNEVYENNLYILSFENAAMMLRTQYGIENNSDILHKNYSLVQSKPDAPLAIYVASNLPEYLNIILNQCEGKITDEESFALEIINNDNLDRNTKERYIRYLTTKVGDVVEVVDHELWTTLLDQQIVPFSVDNFVNYFKIHGMNASLVRYLNKEAKSHDFSKVSDNFGDAVAEDLFNAVAENNGIDNKKYRSVLTDLNFYFDDFESTEISEEKIDILINEKIIKMNLESLVFVREYYHPQLFSFIKANIEEYIKLQKTGGFKLEETLEIITWRIDDQIKIELLSSISVGIPVKADTYSDIVNAHIIVHNLKPEEIPFLFEKYSSFGDNTKAAILELAIQRKAEIISKRLHVDNALLSELLDSENITHDDKVNLFIAAIPGISKDVCKALLIQLELNEISEIFDKGRGRKNYSKVSNLSLILEEFKLKGWIYDYREDNRNVDKLEILKNKPRD